MQGKALIVLQQTAPGHHIVIVLVVRAAAGAAAVASTQVGAAQLHAGGEVKVSSRGSRGCECGTRNHACMQAVVLLLLLLPVAQVTVRHMHIEASCHDMISQLLASSCRSPH